MNITKKKVEPVYVQGFCDCGKELVLSSTLTQGNKTTHNYSCACGIQTQSDQKFPRIDYVLPDAPKATPATVKKAAMAKQIRKIKHR